MYQGSSIVKINCKEHLFILASEIPQSQTLNFYYIIISATRNFVYLVRRKHNLLIEKESWPSIFANAILCRRVSR